MFQAAGPNGSDAQDVLAGAATVSLVAVIFLTMTDLTTHFVKCRAFHHSDLNISMAILSAGTVRQTSDGTLRASKTR